MDAHTQQSQEAVAQGLESPPKAPNPHVDNTLRPHARSVSSPQTDEILFLHDENWDTFSISGLAAVKMLASAMQTLSETMGDIPPTPPASRPASPRRQERVVTPPCYMQQNFPLSPVSPVSPDTPHHTTVTPVAMPSPEAHRDEPAVHPIEADADAEEIAFQRAVIARRFFVKTAPPFSLTDYLLRLHQHCPHSPGVYLAAATFIHRLCVEEMQVPATTKTVHRLALAAIRIASKVVEDNKWSQERIAKVGGTSKKELYRLEVSICFLLNFDMFIREEDLRRRMFLLQQAARQSRNVKRRLSDGFRMRMAIRPKAELAVAAQ